MNLNLVTSMAFPLSTAYADNDLDSHWGIFIMVQGHNDHLGVKSVSIVRFCSSASMECLLSLWWISIATCTLAHWSARAWDLDDYNISITLYHHWEDFPGDWVIRYLFTCFCHVSTSFIVCPPGFIPHIQKSSDRSAFGGFMVSKVLLPSMSSHMECRRVLEWGQYWPCYTLQRIVDCERLWSKSSICTSRLFLIFLYSEALQEQIRAIGNLK